MTIQKYSVFRVRYLQGERLVSMYLYAKTWREALRSFRRHNPNSQMITVEKEK